MIALIVVLVLLAALGILGALVKGLLWLTFIAVALFVGAAVFGWVKMKATSNS